MAQESQEAEELSHKNFVNQEVQKSLQKSVISPFYSYMRDKVHGERVKQLGVSQLELMAYLQDQWAQESPEVIAKYTNQFNKVKKAVLGESEKESEADDSKRRIEYLIPDPLTFKRLFKTVYSCNNQNDVRVWANNEIPQKFMKTESPKEPEKNKRVSAKQYGGYQEMAEELFKNTNQKLTQKKLSGNHNEKVKRKYNKTIHKELDR